MNGLTLARKISAFLALAASILLSGCDTVKLIQPYDADLYKNTESFYKQASLVIARGVSVSPNTPAEVRGIPAGTEASHPGHYSKFKDNYDELLIDSNALILRSLANSGTVGQLGQAIQAKIESAITQTLPSECDDLQGNFPGVSLTTRNYIDLKCLMGRWRVEHQGLSPQGDLTYGKQVLKSGNWEGRHKTLFTAILAIQQAEASKKSDE